MIPSIMNLLILARSRDLLILDNHLRPTFQHHGNEEKLIIMMGTGGVAGVDTLATLIPV